MAQDWDTEIAQELVVGTPGGAQVTIGPNLPPEIELFYAGSSVTIFDFSILMFPGDGNYWYFIVGIATFVVPNRDYFAMGWVRGGVVNEFYAADLGDNQTSDDVMQMVLGGFPGIGGRKNMDVIFGNFNTTGSKNQFTIAHSDIFLGYNAADVGNLFCRYDANFNRTLSVLSTFTVNGKIFAFGAMDISGILNSLSQLTASGNFDVLGAAGFHGSPTSLSVDNAISAPAAFQTGGQLCSVAAATSFTQAVTFPQAFPSVPQWIGLNLFSGSGTTASWNVRAINPTVNGFTILGFGPSTTFTNVNVGWRAVT